MFSSCGSRFQIRSRGRTDLNPVKPPPKQPGVLAVFTTSSVGGGGGRGLIRFDTAMEGFCLWVWGVRAYGFYLRRLGLL